MKVNQAPPGTLRLLYGCSRRKLNSLRDNVADLMTRLKEEMESEELKEVLLRAPPMVKMYDICIAPLCKHVPVDIMVSSGDSTANARAVVEEVEYTNIKWLPELVPSLPTRSTPKKKNRLLTVQGIPGDRIFEGLSTLDTI
ncbi:hypothetical protein K7X08_032503 [Anisodus acutangulus]|uniref:Uncharacterized protein n=1 Tax=Anisodus acutangulus TaxID=402998 RepID=A0A9Q1LMR7_9SOLA|nr:hypothetical protein K7X08_032503 [Anisodus acutangulus]